MATAGVEHVSGRPAPAGAEAVVRPHPATEGELRYSFELADTAYDLWIRSSLAVAPTPDPAAIASLLPAMAAARPLRVTEPIGDATLDSMREAQAVLRWWARSGGWLRALPFADEVELRCTTVRRPPRTGGGPVAAFFSGGVDSLSTVLRHPEITHLIHAIGLDSSREDHELNDAVRARLREAATSLGKDVVEVETNIREMSDLHVVWPAYHGSVLGAIAHLHAGEFSRVIVASGVNYENLFENGSHPLLDRLWGADRVEVVHDGAGLTRVEKLEELADSEVARRALRVCWRNPEDAYNCCRCEKCVRTMVTLEILGVRERFETFPAPLDLGEVALIHPGNRPEAAYWREILTLAVREQAAPELIEAIESAISGAEPEAQVAVARPALEQRPTDPRLATPSLYMRPETRDALEASRAAVFLVGGCDGWANYGDVAQLQATADVFASIDRELIALPVLDPRADSGWQDLGLRAAGGFEPANAVYFAQPVDGLDGIVGDLDLVPVSLPERIRAAGTWLYGGGYLNRRWGRRKLLTVRATEALCSRWGLGAHELISSGLQIEPEWLRGLDPELRELLLRFRQLGVRDELSAHAAAELAGADGPPVMRTGDDAVGVLSKLPTSERRGRAPGEPLVLNLHVCPGSWVNADAKATIDYLRRFVVALAREHGPAVVVQPLIAYDDPALLSERPAAAELTAAIVRAQPGARIAEPTAFVVDDLDAAGAIMRRAALTVSCSYHVALSSLMLEVPAVLVRGGLYYGQKADGLRRDFSLPSELAPALTDDPEAAASAAARAAGLGDPAAPGLRREIAEGRALAIRRRAALEDELGTVLSGLLEADGSAPRRPAVPLADYEALLRASRRTRDRAEALRAEAAWYRARLHDVEGSASWRLTEPIRAAKRRLRRGSEPDEA
jgi:hypothetical protein